jgi:PAS domain S-box-containing protein
MRALPRHGATLWVDAHVTRWTCSQQTVFRVVLQDDTDRVEAHKALERTEDRLRAVLDMSPEAVLATDDTGRITEANESADHMFGFNPGGLLGRYLMELLTPSVDDERVRILKSSFATGQSGAISNKRYEILGRRQDGGAFPLSLSARTLHPDDRGVVFVVRDLTKERTLEQELQGLEETQSVGRLASGMANDFKGLLTNIVHCADRALERLEKGHPTRDHVMSVRQAAETRKALITRLTGSDGMECSSPEPVSLGAEVQCAFSALRPFFEQDISVDVDLQEPGHRTSITRSEVEHILLHVLANAHETTGEAKKIALRTRQVELRSEDTEGPSPLRPGSYLALEIVDCGPRMEPSTRRGGVISSLTREHTGARRGQPMGMVQTIARNHGGDVEITDEAGAAATVRVLLPIVERVCNEPRGAKPCRAAPRATVLVVEDYELVCTSIRYYLSRAGYRVLEARTAADALHVYRSQSGEVDMVLADVVLPDGSGLHLTRRLERLMPHPEIVLVSGYPEEHLRGRSDFDPKTPVLRKPFSGRQLVQTVERRLSNRRRT